MYRFLLLCLLLSACNAMHETKTDSIDNGQMIPQASQANASFPEYAKLQGKWISEEDKNYSFEFEQNMFVERAGSKSDFSEYLLLRDCNNSKNMPAATTGVYIGFQIGSANETYCQYEIMSITDTTLSVMVVKDGKMLTLHKQ